MVISTTLISICLFLLAASADDEWEFPTTPKSEIALGTSDFQKLRNHGQIYVDKTRFISQLLKHGSKYFFLWRPKRFGKSMFLSTLKYFFEGGDQAKALFNGTSIYQEETHWHSYPVLYFDFTIISAAETPKQFQRNLKRQLLQMFKEHAIHMDQNLGNLTFTQILSKLIQDISTLHKKPLVILMDEYDTPVSMQVAEVATANMETMKSLFAVLTDAEPRIKLVFITGVNKYLVWAAKNAYDISQVTQFAEITGFTEGELQSYFSQHIDKLAQKSEKPRGYIENLIKDKYHGYKFAEQGLRVYNPISVFNYLELGLAGNSLTLYRAPACVLDAFRKYGHNIGHFRHYRVARKDLSMAEGNRSNEIPAEVCLFHFGFLTIEGYDQANDSYILNLPNKEVEETFQHVAIRGPDVTQYGDVPRECEKFKNHLRGRSLAGIIDSSNRLAFGRDECNGSLSEQHYNLIMQRVWTTCGVDTTYQRVKEESTTAFEYYLNLTASESGENYVVLLRLGESAKVALGQLVDYLGVIRLFKNGEVVAIGMSVNREGPLIDSASMQCRKNGENVGSPEDYVVSDPIEFLNSRMWW